MHILRRAALLALLTAFSSAALPPATADPLIYSTADAGWKLVTIDFATGETKLIGQTGWGASLGLAYSPDGKLYTVTDTGSQPANGEFYESQLATFDLATGEVTPYGEKNDRLFMALSFTPDGTLYAASFTEKSLYTINLQTGGFTLVGPLGGAGDAMDLVIHPNGKMYSLDHHGMIYEIDPKTGQSQFVSMVEGLSTPMGFTIDAEGNGYVVDYVPQASIYRVELSTGKITGSVQTPFNDLHSAEILNLPLPRLTARREGDHLLISWPVMGMDCVLQVCDGLGAGVEWTDLAMPPVVVADQNTFTHDLLGPQKFFRLRKR